MLKRYTYIYLFFTCFISGQAQINLVQNPGFEIYDTCPQYSDQIYRSLNWYSASQDISNYFNSCAPSSSTASVPDNLAGYQYASSGNAYAGIASYIGGVSIPASSFSEIIGSQLTSTLSIGQKYYMKFKLSCAMGQCNNTAIDKMGIRFCNVKHNSTNKNTFFNNFAHLYATLVVTDTTNWTSLFGSFIADSAYNFIEVGNFFDYSHTNSQIVRNAGSCNTAFYFIDDICVSTDSLYTANWTWSNDINPVSDKNLQIKISPNPSYDGYFYTSINFNKESISILNMMGNFVKQIIIYNGNTFDLSDLENGVYIVEIHTSQYQTRQKLIINK